MTHQKFNAESMGLEVTDEDSERSRDFTRKSMQYGEGEWKSKTNFDKVREFQLRFGLPARYDYTDPDPEEVTLKIRLIAEEFAELIAAMQLNLCEPSDEQFELIADSLADLLYVVYGTACHYGIPMDRVFAEVHRSNMTKSTRRDEGGKITKGRFFSPPNLRKVLWGP